MRQALRTMGAHATTSRTRRISVVAIAALALTGLTACSGQSAADCGGVPSGEASSTVTATGAFDTSPTVEFPTPLVVRDAQKSALIPGDTAPLQDGQPVLVEATILNGTDGSVLGQTEYAEGGGSLLTVGSDELASVGASLECATLGSRIAVVTPADDTPGTAASGSGTVVYVIDVLRAFPSRATGAQQLPVSGMPAVVIAPDGTPGVTIPNEDAPTDYREAVLKQGDGEEVSDDDIVVAKLTAVDWETGTVASEPASSWLTGNASVLRLGQDAATLGSGLVQAVAGQRVGSQVLAVVPPNLAGTGSSGAAPTGTLVYVIDILGTAG